MKPAEMKVIYEEACRTAVNRPVPDPIQAKAWLETLGFFDVKDVRGGLALWWASTSCDERGEIRSKWLPAPAELKPLCEQARRGTQAKRAQGERLVLWQCPDCKARLSGFPVIGASLERRCEKRVNGRATENGFPICGALMEVIADDAAERSTGEMVSTARLPHWMREDEPA